MKKYFFTILSATAMMFVACDSGQTNEGTAAAETTENVAVAGQSAVQDDISQKDVVKIAVGSPDHTTLVKAVQAAELVDVLSNAGPFTVFAPTNTAFDGLPAGTVEGLLKPEKKADLQNVLQYHVTVSALAPESFTDGQTLGMVNGDNAKISVKDGKVMINDANVLGSVKGSNGMVIVIDKVLLPPGPAK